MPERIVGGTAISAVMVAALVCSSPTMASKYDDCILTNMKGVSSDVAAVSIARACLHNSEVPLSVSEVGKIKASAKYVAGSSVDQAGKGFLDIRLTNGSVSQLTSVTISIKDRDSGASVSYTGTQFDLPFAKAADPTKFLTIAPGETREFYLPVAEVTTPAVEYFRTREWSIVSALGFPPSG